MTEITDLLAACRRGEPDAFDRLTAVAYDEMRGVARRLFRHELPGHTLQPTAVVAELYLRMQKQEKMHWNDRAHLFGVCANVMRRILVDHARRKNTVKRGKDFVHVAGLLKVSHLDVLQP